MVPRSLMSVKEQRSAWSIRGERSPLPESDRIGCMNIAVAPLDLISHSADCTRRLGYRLGRRLVGGDVVLLSGDLGAGKTTFAQGLAAGLRVEAPVASPTFTLINEHHGLTAAGAPVDLFHIDLYRLGEGGADTLGLDDYLGEPTGITVVEWPQVAPEEMPESALVVLIDTIDETKRRLRFEARGPAADHYREAVASLRRELFGVSPC